MRRYADSVPDDFLFTVKAPNAVTLTHHYARQVGTHADYAGRPNERFLDPDLMHRFLERLAPLGSKLGLVMLQVEYLNRKKMGSAEEFLAKLDAFLAPVSPEFTCAVETRNPDYLSPALFDCLAARSAGCVPAKGYHMPHIGDVWNRYRPDVGGLAVIRLIGPDRSGIEEKTNKRWDRIVEPRPDGLDAAAAIVMGNAERGIRTFVNVNNHYEGSAPLTIERLLARLRTDR